MALLRISGFGILVAPITPITPPFDLEVGCESDWILIGGSDIDVEIPGMMHIEGMGCIEESEADHSVVVPADVPEAYQNLSGGSFKEWDA